MLEEVKKTEAVEPEEQAQEPTVQDYLEMALQLAGEQEMKTSELMGIFFYYAHSIAESYRQEVLSQQPAGDGINQNTAR